MIILNIHCDPSPWQAPISGKNGHYDPKAKEKEMARWQIKSLYRGALIAGHYALDFTFHIPIPKSTSKARRTQMLRHQILPTSPDLTNMQKLYEDCLQGIVTENDRYTSAVSTKRIYSEHPGVTIRIIPWEEFTGMKVDECLLRAN